MRLVISPISSTWWQCYKDYKIIVKDKKSVPLSVPKLLHELRQGEVESHFLDYFPHLLLNLPNLVQPLLMDLLGGQVGRGVEGQACLVILS